MSRVLALDSVGRSERIGILAFKDNTDIGVLKLSFSLAYILARKLESLTLEIK